MVKDIAELIKTMRIRSATRIAVAALWHLYQHAEKKGLGASFDREAKRMEDLRPTAVVLHNALEFVRNKRTLDSILYTIDTIDSAKHRIGVMGAKLFKRRAVIMTHCESTEAESMLIHSKKKIARVYATETRPIYQGVSTAKRLAKEGIDTVLIVDGACGIFMPEVDAVVVGADALRKEGMVNKIGTMPMLAAAKAFGKPVYVAANSLKVDRRKKFSIEYRSPKEVIEKAPAGVDVLNPVFDITPWKLIDKIITERRIYTSYELAGIL